MIYTFAHLNFTYPYNKSPLWSDIASHLLDNNGEIIYLGFKNMNNRFNFYYDLARYFKHISSTNKTLCPKQHLISMALVIQTI